MQVTLTNITQGDVPIPFPLSGTLSKGESRTFRNVSLALIDQSKSFKAAVDKLFSMTVAQDADVSDLVEVPAAGGGLSTAIQQGIFGTPTFTVAAEAGDDRDITIQAKDINGADLAKKVELLVWLSDTNVDAIGTALTAFAVQGTGTLLQTVTANLVLRILTDATGKAVVRGSIAGAASRFVNVLVGGDVHARSAEVTWT